MDEYDSDYQTLYNGLDYNFVQVVFLQQGPELRPELRLDGVSFELFGYQKFRRKEGFPFRRLEMIPNGGRIVVLVGDESEDAGTTLPATPVDASTAIATGATTARTLSAHFGDVLSVKDFGAVGDGVTDDSQAFVDAAASGKAILVTRPATFYAVSRSVELTASFIGDGSMPEIRMLGADGTIAKRMFTVTGYGGPGILIAGLHLNGGWDGVAAAGEQSHLVSVTGSSNVSVENNFLENAYGDAVTVEANVSANSGNVTVRGNRITNTYRCAVAVVAAFGVRVLHNTIVKNNPYVAVIDIEPNLDSATFVENVLIDGNTVSAPATYFVNIFSPPTYPNTVRSIAVSHNRVQALYGVRKSDITGPMADISITDNEFLNHTGTSVECRGALIAHNPSNGTTLTGVVYARNIDRITMSNGGLTHGSSFSNVLGLVIANNVIDGARSTGLIVGSSPGAIITGNSIKSTLGVALDVVDYSGLAFNGLLVESNYFGNEVLVASAPLSNAIFTGNVFSPPAGTTHLVISGTGATLSGSVLSGNLYLGTGTKISGTRTNVINRDTGNTWFSFNIAAGGPFTVDASLFEMWSGLAGAGTGAFTVAAPTNGYTGQSIDIRIRNGTGGALGAVTWDAVYKMAAWVAPANGQSTIIKFRYDGANWVEVGRATAIPN